MAPVDPSRENFCDQAAKMFVSREEAMEVHAGPHILHRGRDGKRETDSQGRRGRTFGPSVFFTVSGATALPGHAGLGVAQVTVEIRLADEDLSGTLAEVTLAKDM